MLKTGCVLILFLSVVRAIYCPDNKSQCEAGSTCCLISFDRYGCCPLRKAVCCEDKIHCCPHGYICDLSDASCFQGSSGGLDGKTNMALKRPASLIKVNTGDMSPIYNPHVLDMSTLGNVMCPDRCSTCPTGTTCCLLESGQYGCCQYSSAVCCDDHVHCCPQNYKCNIPYCTPLQQYIELPMKRTSENNDNGPYLAVISHMCPDQKSRCGNGKKCCSSHKGYKCCDYHHGECCSDALHCCPKGFTCDLVNKKCRKKLKNIPMAVKFKAKPINSAAIPHSKKQKCNTNMSKNKVVPNQLCPDNKTTCPDNNTCCDNALGATFCCPFPTAVCCAKSSHCCPKGFECEPGGAGLCNKIPAVTPNTIKGELYDITCPDGVSQCPDSNTCCLVKSGGYGCCPIANAVCCKDMKHCCPAGYKCNDGEDYCIQGEAKIPTLKLGGTYRVAAIIAQSKLTKKPRYLMPVPSKFTCPDKESVCFQGETCCQLRDGHYGCCPMPNAVCCKDEEHCCPHGYRCIDGFCTCSEKFLIAKHTQAVQNVFSVICPDGRSECPDGNTCCKLSTGAYGCCPFPKAVCCSDHMHCCPQGFKCSAGGYCHKGSERILASKHTQAVQNVICPDGKSECPDGNTCCKLSTGAYGCCPFPKAVCCSDHMHCCPQGFKCSAGGYCNKGSERMLASKHTQAVQNVFSVKCPDGKSECPDRNTCCMLSSGVYGCCPLPNAVCCSDHEHCCQHGYKCTAEGTCTRGSETLLAAKPTKALQKRNIICPDGLSKCNEGSTCCKLATSRYGCCPLPHAVCCSDMLHCCPHGFKCTKEGFCLSGESKVPALKHSNVLIGSKLRVPSKNKNIVVFPMNIPKKNKINQNKLSRPQKYERFRVSRNRIDSLDGRDRFLLSILRHEMKVCADGYRRCKQYETCCPSSHGYICCPFYNAVCCKDMCCPPDSDCSNEGVCERYPAYNEPIKFKP